MDGGGAVRGRYGPEAGGGDLTSVPRTANNKGPSTARGRGREQATGRTANYLSRRWRLVDLTAVPQTATSQWS